MATWFCYECDEDMGDKEYCPYCGAHRLGDMAMTREEAIKIIEGQTCNLGGFFRNLFKRKNKTPIFSEEESVLYDIHPDDEMYRKTMELDILGKNYKE